MAGELIYWTGSKVAGNTAGSSGQAAISGGSGAPTFGTLTVPGGGTGLATLTTAYGVVCAGTTATGALQNAGAGTAGQALISGGASALPAFGTLGVAGGGTGAATLTNHGVLLGQGTSAIVATSVGATGTVLAGSTGADPAFTATPALTSVTLSGGTALSTYAEGTWTPVITFGGGSTGITYTNQAGYYTRIGRIVVAQFFITLSNKGSSTGAALITGLPFTALNSIGGVSQVSMRVDNLTFSVGHTYAGGVSQNNTTNITVQSYGSATAAANLADTNFANDTNLEGTLVYFGQ